MFYHEKRLKAPNNYTPDTPPWDEIFNNNCISFAIFPQFLQRNWLFPASPAVNYPDFAITVTVFFDLCRINRKENSSCSACGHPLQDLTHLVLNCSASEPLWRAIFGTISSIFNLWSKPSGVARLLGIRAPVPRKGSA